MWRHSDVNTEKMLTSFSLNYIHIDKNHFKKNAKGNPNFDTVAHTNSLGQFFLRVNPWPVFVKK